MEMTSNNEAQVAPLRDERDRFRSERDRANSRTLRMWERAKVAEAELERLLLIIEGGESAEGAMRAVREVGAIVARAGAAESALRQVREVLDEVGTGTEAFTYVQEWWAVKDRIAAVLDSVRVGAADGLGDWFRRTPESLAMLTEETKALAEIERGAAYTQPEGDGWPLDPSVGPLGGVPMDWGVEPNADADAQFKADNAAIREAQNAVDLTARVSPLTPTAGGKVDTAPEACPLDAGERPYWMGVDQYDPCKCLLTKGHAPPCVCSHAAPESGE